MTHDVMNQTGHGLPNLIGMNARGLDDKVNKVLPEYMTMGEKGMGGTASTWGTCRSLRTASPCAAPTARTGTSTWAGCSRS